MKKITIIAALLLSANLFAQQNPTGPAIPVNSTPPTLQQHAWYRGGNFAGAAGGNKNIFGTMWNSPVYHYASSLQRMNVGFLAPGASLVGVGGFPNPMPANRLTRVAINRDGNAPIQRPLSLLHIGYDFPLLPQGGQRNWMDIGMMAMSGTDHVFLGLRQKSNTATGLPSTFLINPNDQQDAVLNWGDNDSGPDNLCFIYTAPPSFGVPRSSTNDGREMMRMIPNGNVGLGPVFSDGNQPKSNYHMHNENSLSNWLQITNENLPGVTQSNFPAASGTVNANDGFRIGILGHNNGQRNGNALIYNQENRHLLFSTNANTNNVTPNNTLERMRITSIAAPTSLANGGYGVYSPAGLNGNLTRVAISHDPQSPVTRPLSLLHLGYNTGAVGFNPASTDGWRDWMDIGIFTNNGTDNMYVGLKTEAGSFPANDRQDAVVNWGDNDASNPFNGPDNLRFIFTSTTTGSGNSPANSNKGLETMRINPDTASTMGGNFGMVGIGDYSPGSLNDGTLDAKLDIDGDLRIRTVTKDTTLLQVLVIDSNDRNRVHWRSINGLVTANNGVSVNTTTGAVQLGVPCTDSIGNPDTTNIFANAFTTDRVVANRNYNLWFASRNNETGGVGVGGQPIPTTFCNTGNTFEISANKKNTKYGNTNASGLRLTKLTSASPTLANGTNGLNNTKVLTVDSLGDVVLVDAVGGSGGIGNLCSQPQNPLTGSYEVPLNNRNFSFTSNGKGNVQIGDVYCNYSPPARLYVRNSYGVSGVDVGIWSDCNGNSANANYGIYSSAANGGPSYAGWFDASNSNPLNRAGYFNGDLEYTGLLMGSDQMFKTDVENIKGASDILRKLKPHTYKMDVIGFPQFNFQDRLQYGFIAQEVGEVLPNLVHDSHMPSKKDSLGNEISPAVNYKSLNYNALIPITVQAVNELNERLDKATLSDQNVKTNVQNLANSLDKVKQMRGVSYEWSSTAQNDMNLDSLQHIGFIAQEVAAIEPLLTFVDDSSLVHVNYDRVVPLLVESVKELDGKVQSKDSIIENLETRLAYLEECIARANICEEGNRTMNNEPNNTTNNRSIELVNINSIILDQNMPNPFAENTVINYNIPTEVMEAKLLFYDLNGRIIKELIIEERGESKLTVYGTNLKTGVYTYSLIADGELIATKKMVKK